MTTWIPKPEFIVKIVASMTFTCHLATTNTCQWFFKKTSIISPKKPLTSYVIIPFIPGTQQKMAKGDMSFWPVNLTGKCFLWLRRFRRQICIRKVEISRILNKLRRNMMDWWRNIWRVRNLCGDYLEINDF